MTAAPILPLWSRGRAPAREAAGNQRPWPADKVEQGLDEPGAGGRGRWADRGPREDTRRPTARYRRNPGDGRRGLDRGAEAGLCPGPTLPLCRAGARLRDRRPEIKGRGLPTRSRANTSPLSRGRAPARQAAGNQRPWPADKVERWSIDRLIPYAKNARTQIGRASCRE